MSIFREHKTSADRSANDRSRHRKKIEQAIKEGISHVVADESIIGQDGKKRIKIPVRGIKEYKFVYGDNSKSVGSSAGNDVRRGQTIGSSDDAKAGKKPGDQQGEEFYEIEISLEELASYLFDDLSLPDLEKKMLKKILSDKRKRKGYRKSGIRPRLDKRQTLINKIKRKKASVQAEESVTDESFSINEKDLRYRHVKVKPDEVNSAVVFFVMDTSGSMDDSKKFLARSFFFLIYQFLRYKYEEVDVVFVSHDVEAREVDEERFFTKGSSGGTSISPALEMVRGIVEKRYHPTSWNVYIFQCSDGDNWETDIQRSVTLAGDLKQVSQMMCYCEVCPGDEKEGTFKFSESTMFSGYKPLVDRKFKMVKLTCKEDVWPSFSKIFGGKLNE